MRYFKNIDNGYIVSISTNSGAIEITAEEYNTILDTIKSRPTAPEGFDYILKSNLTWELVELPEETEIEGEFEEQI